MPRAPGSTYRPHVETFLVESYVPNLDSATAAELSSRLRSAVTELQREGLPLQWLRSFALVEDETYVWMVDAPDAGHVALVHTRAAVSVDHIAAVSGGRE
jgi:hypothetical protein